MNALTLLSLPTGRDWHAQRQRRALFARFDIHGNELLGLQELEHGLQQAFGLSPAGHTLRLALLSTSARARVKCQLPLLQAHASTRLTARAPLHVCAREQRH